MVVFLFVLAVFDLYVGVSNDAVNFMNSAIGSKAARFRTVVIVASVGVLCGAIMSNGHCPARHIPARDVLVRGRYGNLPGRNGY